MRYYAAKRHLLGFRPDGVAIHTYICARSHGVQAPDYRRLPLVGIDQKAQTARLNSLSSAVRLVFLEF
jgi:hypothetical protein